MTFQYQRLPNGVSFPVIPLRFSRGNKVLDALALIDSGATISVFQEEIAQELGLKIESGKEIYLSGVGGRIKGYSHNLEISVAGKKIVCPVIFSHEFSVSFNLLGRSGVFDKFRITFDEKNQEITII